MSRNISKSFSHIYAAPIRDHYLLEISPEHLAQAIDSLRIFKHPFTPELGEQIRGSFDRTGDKLREETHIGEELNDVPRRLNLSPVDIYRIAEGLESVETDPDRKDQMQEYSIRLAAQEKIRETLGKEIIVFEQTQYPEIQDYVGGADPLGFATVLPIFEYQQTTSPAAE